MYVTPETYHNGSVHNLVQWEGSPEYKHPMRRSALGDKSSPEYVIIDNSSYEKIPQFPVNNQS